MLEPFGFTGPVDNPDLFTNFLLTVNLRPFDISVLPDSTPVFSILEFLNVDTIGFRISLSTLGTEEEDLFQNETQAPNLLPGFIVSQLGSPFTSYAGRLVAEFIESDFNSDTVVDAADYTMWRDNLSATDVGEFGPGDSDGDGQVTAADFQLFVDQFGATLGSPAPAAVAIPEPATLALLLPATMAWRRRPALAASPRRRR